MGPIEVFAPGSKVSYGPDGGLAGEVNRVTLSRDGRVEYEVGYFHQGELKFVWLHADQVAAYAADSPRRRIGFRDQTPPTRT